MSESFACGDPGALVAYVYDECEPEEREHIATHVAQCVSCSREIDELASTRRHLRGWTPPSAALGFQISVPEVESRLPWWRAPLPAWAQVAAAAVIFGAGLSVGLARVPASPASVASTQPVAVQPTAETASRAELTQVEERLKTAIAGIRPMTPVQTSKNSDEDLLQRVQALIEQSEERQRREFTLRSVQQARDFEAQRRVDLASVRETVGQLQGVTGAEIRQQREAIDRISSFIRVSQQGR